MPIPGKLRALVVDDEPLARKNLVILLRAHPNIEILESGSGADAIAQIRTHKPDLVFLDVQMPEFDGFDVLEMVGGDMPAAVVFVTAHDQYALRAFEAGALDYLLKPFDDGRFEVALKRAYQKVESARTTRSTAGKLGKIPVKQAGAIVFIKPEQIDWIEAADYYTCLHVGLKSHLVRRSMADLEKDLDSEMFCRIHRSTIVNINRVERLAVDADGDYEVVLAGDIHLRLSRRYRQHLQERLGLR